MCSGYRVAFLKPKRGGDNKTIIEYAVPEPKYRQIESEGLSGDLHYPVVTQPFAIRIIPVCGTYKFF